MHSRNFNNSGEHNAISTALPKQLRKTKPDRALLTWRVDLPKTVQYKIKSMRLLRMPFAMPVANSHTVRVCATVRNVTQAFPRLAARQYPACDCVLTARQHRIKTRQLKVVTTGGAAKTASCAEKELTTG